MSTDERGQIEQLLTALHSVSAIVRRNAMQKLDYHTSDPQIIEILLTYLEENDLVELETFYISGELSDEADYSDTLEIATGILCRLGTQLALIEPQAFERLLTIFQTKDALARPYAARVLGTLHNPLAVAPLLAALQAGDIQTTREVTKALDRLREYQVIEKLMLALRKAVQEQNQPRTDALATALSDLGDTRAIEPLLATLKTYPTSAIIKALASFKDPAAIEPLIACLQDPEASIRVSAAEALAALAARQAIVPLIACLQDAQASVRAQAVSTLASLVAEQAIEPLIACLQDPAADVRARAATALAFLKATQAIEPLIACLQDPERDVRAATARALGKLGDVRGLEKLIYIWLTDPSGYVRHQALAEILRARNPHIYEQLLAHYSDATDQASNQKGMQPQEPLRPYTSSTTPLIAGLQDPDPRLRTAAARILAIMSEADRPGFFTGLRELRTLLIQDPDDNVRSTVFNALVATKKMSIYYLLRDLLNGKDQKLSTWAASALEQWDTSSQRI